MTWEHIAYFFIAMSTWFCFVCFYKSKEIDKNRARIMELMSMFQINRNKCILELIQQLNERTTTIIRQKKEIEDNRNEIELLRRKIFVIEKEI